MRIAAIHALRLSVAPTMEAFARLWPEASLANLLDDSLSADLARAGRIDAAMTGRFLALARYAVGSGASGILFTCSAFGPCIEACAEAFAPMPVLKPNEAMIAEAAAHGAGTHDERTHGGRAQRGGAQRGGARLGLIATFAPTLASMPREFAADAPGLTVVPCLAEGALAALDAGDGPRHDARAADAAAAVADCDVIALAQFSLARAAPAIAAATGRPVLTTPDSAVRELRRRLGA